MARVDFYTSRVTQLREGRRGKGRRGKGRRGKGRRGKGRKEERWRKRGKEGRREGGKEGRREGKRRDGGREGREGRREGGKEGRKEEGRKEERWRKRGKRGKEGRREGKRREGGKGEKEWMYSFTLMNMTYTSLVPRPSLWCVYCTEDMGMRLDIHMVRGDRGGDERRERERGEEVKMKGWKEEDEKKV